MVVESLSSQSFTGMISNRRAILGLALFICYFLAAGTEAFAQREYTVIRPRVRTSNEKVAINRRASRPTTGILQVVLDPVISGKVVITDDKGRVVEEADAGDDGQVTFELRRGKSYLVKADSPGFVSVEKKSPVLMSATSVRLQLKGQFAKLELPGLPVGAQILIDGNLRATADQSLVVLDNLEPGQHTLLVRHPEYNEYQVVLRDLEAGIRYPFYPMSTILIKVAKLTILGPAGARVLIDGAVEGIINPDGVVRIDYELEKASEHTIGVELLGFQTWSQRETLSPGPRTFIVRLDPIVTDIGDSDLFDNLSLWHAPDSWKIVSEGRNNKLEIKGDQLGLLKDRTYRNFGVFFTVWFDNAKGATWAVRADKGNYYLFHLAGPNSTSRAPRRFYTYIVRDGGAPEEVSTPIPVVVELNPKSSYQIEILVEGYEIRHWIHDPENGERIDLGVWTDKSATREKFLYGSFGFRALSDEVFTVDDLTVTLDLKQFKK